MKAVLFATGPAAGAAREITALSGHLGPQSVRVVAPASSAGELRADLPEIKIHAVRFAAGPLLILRLWAFLGWSPAEIYCLSPGGGQRLLKLTAYALRGRVVFVRPEGRARLGLFSFVWISLSRLWARENGALLIGSAGPATLARLEEDLRKRRPGASIRVLRDPSIGEFFRVAAEWRRYRYLSIPWTGEGHNFLKVAAWLLPCGRREIYNEQGDSFSVRRVSVLLRHVWWRASLLWLRLLKLPPGVTVLGSASGYYLKDILADLRRRHPGEPVHGLLPPRLVNPAGGLFDSVTVLRPLAWSTWGALLGRSLGRDRTGWYVIPCTNEGFYGMKLMGAMLPMGRREIYNENHDGCPLRNWRMIGRHIHWRLRHRLFYQALTELHGRSWLSHILHLLVYPVRLLAGAVLLVSVRLRTATRRGQHPTAAADAPRLDTVSKASTPQPEEVFDTAER